MTLIAWLIIIPGFICFVWPLYFLLIRKNVNTVQWLYSLSSVIIGLSIVFYSGFFNTHLHGEYFVGLLYSCLVLLAAPVFYLFVHQLTSPDGLTVKVSKLMIVPFVMIVILLCSSMVAGRETYRLMMERSIYNNDLSFTGSFRYDQLLFTSYYLFFVVLIVEVAFVGVVCIRKFISYFRLLDEYHVAKGEKRLFRTNLIVMLIIMGSVLVALAILAKYPLHKMQSIPLLAFLSVLISITTLLLGMIVSMVSVSAVEIANLQNPAERRLGNVRWVGQKDRLEYYHKVYNDVVDFVEVKKHFLDRTLTLEKVSDATGYDPMDISEALRFLNGRTFPEYLENLRLDRAFSTLLLQSEDDDAQILRYKIMHTDFLERIAFDNAFENAEHFTDVFRRVMGQSLFDWISESVDK